MARNPFVRCRLDRLAICLCAGLAASPLPAQLEPAPAAGGGGPAAESQASPGGKPPAAVARVVAAVSSEEDRNRAALGDGITLTVENLEPMLQSVEKGCEGLILFLNDIPIKGVPPDSCGLATGQVHFTLDRTDDSDKAWHTLLEEPIAFTKIVTVSAGPEDGLSFPSTVNDFELVVLPALKFYSFLAGLLVFLVLLFRLAIRTTLLRDSSELTPAGQLPPYSLARFQMAFWSFLVVAAYVFIWMITRELDTITGSVLALLGIGSATALGASLIDAAKPAGAADGGTDEQRQPVPAAARAKVVASRGFLRDVLSDPGGISLYRFQLFVWTLVLGIIFVSSVYRGLQMPQFNPTLLGLMGISSGTYLGFKVPESRTPPAGS